jgi:hypothetical protein
MLLRLIESTHTVHVRHAFIVRSASCTPASADALGVGCGGITAVVAVVTIVAAADGSEVAGLPDSGFGGMWVWTGDGEKGEGGEG